MTMPRKPTKRPKYTEPSLPIAKLDNVPGPEADGDVLKAHYRRVQDIFATHRYDDIIQTCHWCCDMEAGLAYSKTDVARGTRMFCSGRCASAYTAYQVKVLHLDKKAQARPPNGDDKTADDPDEAPPEPTPEPEGEVDPIVEAHDDDPDMKADAERHLRDASVREREQERMEARTKAKRKPRATKEPRADGKCPKGLHEMTPDNQYHYQDKVWCRECRKASRAKSAANGKGARA